MKNLIHPYSKKFVEIFEKEKKNISSHIDNVEIQHIGSTSIPDLGGKGMVDILIGIKTWKELGRVISCLVQMDFKHVHEKENGRVFLSKIGPTKARDVHIHIVIMNGKPYKELIFFRNYLRNNKNESKKFFKLKQEWAKESKEDRKRYGKLKEKYVKEVLKKQKKFRAVRN